MFENTLNESQSRLDRLQLVALGGLMVLGTLFVYSATMVSEAAFAAKWYNQLWVRQIVWYCLGGAGAVAVCLLDYRSLSRWSLIAYWLSIVLLVAVLIPKIGSLRFGARRWIDLGFFQFQPSEFAKLAFILALAHFASRPAEELRAPWLFWKGAWPDDAALPAHHEGAGPRLRPRAAADRVCHDVRRRHARAATSLRLLGGVGVLGALSWWMSFLPRPTGRSSFRIISGGACWSILTAITLRLRCVPGGARTPAQTAVR